MDSKASKLLGFSEFLLNSPPGAEVELELEFDALGGTFKVPTIVLDCTRCSGKRNFELYSVSPRHEILNLLGEKTLEINLKVDRYYDLFLVYRCNNCRSTSKVYSINIKCAVTGSLRTILGCKYGERPPFGPPLPKKLLSLMGADRELFLKGYRCERQGLGIGSFTYYRRVVENQTSRILANILKVAQEIDAPKEDLDRLASAIAENQFSNALDTAKSALPQRLLIQGHNPLRFLHDNLSDGVHNLSDSECLEIAHDIRIVLSELSVQLEEALKEDKEVKEAFSNLMKRTADRRAGKE